MRRNDDGFTLIEAMVAAIIFASVVTLSAQTLIHATNETGRSYARNTATGILQTAIEKVRGMDASGIAAGPVSSVQTVKGVEYTTTTTSSYADTSTAGGDVCTSTATSLRHKRVIVAVTYPDGGRTVALSAETLRTSANPAGSATTGALAVRLTDAARTATRSGTVLLSDGTSTLSSVTDGAGCALFTGLRAGTWTAFTTLSGLVADNGTDTATTGGISVTAGTLARGSLRFDPAHSLTVSLDSGTAVLPSGLTFLLSGNYLPANLIPVCIATPVTPCMTGSPGLIQHLFADNYSVQAGQCGSTTGLSAASADLRTSPSASLTIPMSTVTLVVRNASGVAISDGRAVTFTKTSSTLCPNGSETVTSRVDAGTTTFALPFGSWTVTVPSQSTTSTSKLSMVANTSSSTKNVTLTATVTR